MATQDNPAVAAFCSRLEITKPTPLTQAQRDFIDRLPTMYRPSDVEIESAYKAHGIDQKTLAQLNAETVYVDPKDIPTRFGGEGE